MNALHWSCFHGSLEHSKELLKMGLDIMSRDNEGKTPAHWAATTQNVALMQQLVLAYSLHPFAKAARDDPALRACHIMNVPDNQGRTPLHVAVGIGNAEITELILSVDQAKVDIQDIHGRTPLHWAVQLGHPKMIKLLMDRGGLAQFKLLDANGWTALHYAAHEKYVDCAEELLKYDGIEDQADIHGQTALMLAILSVERDLVHLLIEKQISDVNAVDETGSTPLHVAAFVGVPDFCQRLLSAGASVDVEESLKQTPLFFACEQGHLDAVKCLVNADANTKHTESEGRNVLHFAAIGGHSPVCNYLIGKIGIDVNAIDKGGRSPLHTAAHAGDAETAACLIDREADVNLQDLEGITPLHWAAASGSLECVGVLMAASAFPNHTEYHQERYTPLNYATMAHANNEELNGFMREQGALSIQEIRNLAAQHIQSWWAGYRSRIRLLAAWQQSMMNGGKKKYTRGSMARRKDGTNVAHRNKQVSPTRTSPVRDKPGGKKDRFKNKVDIPDMPGKSGSIYVSDGERTGSGGIRLDPLGKQPRVRNSVQRKNSKNSMIIGAEKKPPHRLPAGPHAPEEPSEREVRKIRMKHVKKERNRVNMVREKISAACVIQKWWRMIKSSVNWDTVAANKDALKLKRKLHAHALEEKKRSREQHFHRKKPVTPPPAIAIDPTDDTQQIAALTIQLFWRQHMSRKRSLMNHPKHFKHRIATPAGPQKQLYPWSPEVMRSTRQQREAIIYSQPTQRSLNRWDPQLSPSRYKQAKVDVKRIPLVSVTAFNLATATYWPAEVQKRFDRKQQALADVEASADQVLDNFLANMKRVRQLKLDEMPVANRAPIDNHNRVYELLKQGDLPNPNSDLLNLVGQRSPQPQSA